ncbi:LacI family DNA-binding transcriptional regulator [Paenibacillus silvae]|uniref:LacI family DNA-binding transcriptional regulator n=1 Tax=Paenibacillus silvae TaxID=1325358 RepID=UPI0020039434|nr:LacI family DNA-binding transcriptional regulator [Paenibacillus silvae]MCK6073331.1 LacI family transcriptional regulator [Paenibacillus silvae]MCK6149193.1 LacI family transcriptional regulator [Paenibacillus silvae]MCK6267492.1 LacI family transcriptional regulator [Paenibacillus silvae]
MNQKLNYSLRELAELAGVSKSTASRVISGNGYASPDVRERVLQAADQLRYKPSAVARAMVTKRTYNIGVIVFRDKLPIVSHTLYGRIIDEILMAAEALGYSIFLKTDREMSLRSTDYMLEQRVDGLILISRLQKNVIDYVKKFNIPYLMVNGSTEDPDVVHLVSNDEAGGERAAEHLAAGGHRKFFVIAGPGEHRSHSLRLKGFCQRLESLGISSSQGKVTIVKSLDSSFESGHELMEQHFNSFREAQYSAIFCTNDMLALGAMKVMLDRGMKVPEEAVVMGYDNTELSSMVHPSLTTVSVDAAGIGRDAVSILDRLIRGEENIPRLTEYESHVLVRQSTTREEK